MELQNLSGVLSDCQFRVFQGALAGGGRLYFEINPLFAADLVRMLGAEGFRDIEVHKDISRRDRFISCSK